MANHEVAIFACPHFLILKILLIFCKSLKMNIKKPFKANWIQQAV